MFQVVLYFCNLVFLKAINIHNLNANNMDVNKNNYCVIMAGGVGARFWPMSKTSRPKQFIDVLGVGKTLIRLTFERFANICPPENVLVVTNEIYKDLVLEQLPELTEKQVLCEPSRRNTAPCVAYANYKIKQENPNAMVVVAPSDHIILMEDEFVANIKTAIKASQENEVVVAPSDHIILMEDEFVANIKTAIKASQENDWLLTLGIKPSRPDTGYGYIQYIDKKTYADDVPMYKVNKFTEKPTIDVAKQFLASGDYLWNSGIFIWSLKSIMGAFTELLPNVDTLFEKGLGKYNTPEEEAFIAETYAVCENIIGC